MVFAETMVPWAQSWLEDWELEKTRCQELIVMSKKRELLALEI